MNLRDREPRNVHRPACQAKPSRVELPSVRARSIASQNELSFLTLILTWEGQGSWNLVDGYSKQMNSQASHS